MSDARRDLEAIVLEARRLLARPGNDFQWSSWPDVTTALQEIDDILAALSAGEPPDEPKIKVLFLPTGDIQEVSITSGWSDEFLALSKKFDTALARFTRRRKWWLFG